MTPVSVIVSMAIMRRIRYVNKCKARPNDHHYHKSKHACIHSQVSLQRLSFELSETYVRTNERKEEREVKLSLTINNLICIENKCGSETLG